MMSQIKERKKVNNNSIERKKERKKERKIMTQIKKKKESK